MLKIDTHQHFWRYHPVKDAWITDDMSVIRRDLLPGDLAPLLEEHAISGCIAVQADQSENENTFLMELASRYPFIKGIVGWVDLRANDIAEQLDHNRQYTIIKGFRHIVQAEREGYMLDERFINGISLLNRFGFTYDILISASQLKEAEQLVAMFPQQRFVIDHMAKPPIKQQATRPWQADIEAIASHHNVYCKVSGFCTEADWENWTYDHIVPYLDIVYKAFGPERVMFGSDWPVNNLAGGYSKTMACVQTYMEQFDVQSQQKFWAKNALTFYNIKI